MLSEVETFLANGGRVRRFESGASGNPITVLEWLRVNGVKADYMGHSRIRIGKQITNLAGLYDRVNAMRRQQGLEPFTLDTKSETRGHFCFGAQRRRASA